KLLLNHSWFCLADLKHRLQLGNLGPSNQKQCASLERSRGAFDRYRRHLRASQCSSERQIRAN
ncbi:hypothetical protein, partial [Phyllobacterium endophyticum]|uniref:hypothetical protein n=1 Tax=Phyllobacterium endophyticum TaxID=1149773 RepID=UPI001AED3CF2